ncbi:MAG: hypothetical protein ABIK39_00935 [candidate division WOR-3 bacterium]
MTALVNASPKEEEIIRARDLCYFEDYQRAAELIENLSNRYPDEPAVIFWQAAFLQMLIYDSGQNNLLDSFYRVSDRVVRLCKERLRENPRDGWAQFYWGLTELNRANCQSWQNRKLTAFLTMLKARGHFHRALTLKPELEDAWLGIGVIEYFKATADRYCGGLGLIGSKGKAFQLVSQAQKKGGLLQPMAEYLLGFMAKEEKRFEDAVQWSCSLLFRYPNNRTTRRLLRDIYLDMSEYTEVIEIGRKLESDIINTFPNNRYGLAENRLKMAYAYEGLNQLDSAQIFCERIIAWEEYQNFVPWLANYIQEAKRLRKRISLKRG